MLLFFILISLAVIMFFVIRAQKKPDDDVEENIPTGTPSIPEKLLDLKTTTVAERQRAYNRSFQKQRLYDILQAQAEAAGDTSTIEAIRTNTYKGKFPVFRPDGSYTHYTSNVYEFEIAGMMYRDMKKVAKCEGVSDARLVAEPDNEFDPDAIKVIHESNTHVGYIPRDDTSLVRSIVTLPANCFVHIFCNDDDTDAHGKVYIEIKKQ
jgi:hypothetical protein